MKPPPLLLWFHLTSHRRAVGLLTSAAEAPPHSRNRASTGESTFPDAGSESQPRHRAQLASEARERLRGDHLAVAHVGRPAAQLDPRGIEPTTAQPRTVDSIRGALLPWAHKHRHFRKRPRVQSTPAATIDNAALIARARSGRSALRRFEGSARTDSGYQGLPSKIFHDFENEELKRAQYCAARLRANDASPASWNGR